MNKKALLSALITGCFCAVFAVVVTALGMIISIVPGLAIAFVSGFLGSLFASYIVKAA